jgi:hypothetical protein
VTFVSVAGSQGTCTFLSRVRTVRCDLGSLSSGGGGSITIVVKPTVRGTIRNSAVVGANQSDPNTANNTAAVETVSR